MLEKILLYNVKRPQDIIKAASNMRIISGFINESDTDRTLAEIAADVRGISLSDAEGYQPQENKESLVVFCDVTDKHIFKSFSSHLHKHLLNIPLFISICQYSLK